MSVYRKDLRRICNYWEWSRLCNSGLKIEIARFLFAEFPLSIEFKAVSLLSGEKYFLVGTGVLTSCVLQKLHKAKTHLKSTCCVEISYGNVKS